MVSSGTFREYRFALVVSHPFFQHIFLPSISFFADPNWCAKAFGLPIRTMLWAASVPLYWRAPPGRFFASYATH